MAKFKRKSEDELFFYDDFGVSAHGGMRRSEYSGTFNLDAILDTYTNWNSSQADRERTIFGRKEEGLFYNYSDRLDEWDYEKGKRAREYAAELGADHRTGRYMTAMLSYFHDGAVVELRHVIAGCNRSNGYPYLIYGYKYKADTSDADRLFQYEEIRNKKKMLLEEAKSKFTEKFDEVFDEVLGNSQQDTELK